MVILSKAMYRFKAVLIKIPIIFFPQKTNHTKIVETTKTPQIAKAILRKEDKAETAQFLIATILQSYSNQNSMLFDPKSTRHYKEEKFCNSMK